MSLTQVLGYDTCPTWCITEHGQFDGEEDHVHTGPHVRLTPHITARLCASVDLDSGMLDGPYVVVDSHELTLDQARRVGEALIRLTATATDVRMTDTLPRPRQKGC